MSSLQFQEHLPSITQPIHRALSLIRPDHRPYSLFPTVTNEQSFQDHLPSRTLLVLTSQCPGRPEKQTCRVCALVSLMDGHFNTISQVKLSIQKALSGKTSTATMQRISLPVSPLTGHPFQDISWVALPTPKALCPERPEP